jgi:NTP pyrophosphatase (non-canonical NTP hydrolase)
VKFRDYREWRPTYSLYEKNYVKVDSAHEEMSVIGLAAEAGELLGVVQKAGRKQVDVDRTKIIDELGDVLWYMCYVMDAFDISMNELTDFNKNKLEERNQA